VPPFSSRLQRTALCYLILGLALGALLLAVKGLGWPFPYGRLMLLHAELLLVGWLLQFTMGVAHWMLPKHASGPERGPDAPIAAAWLLLNVGVWLAGLGPVLGWPAAVVGAGRGAEAAAVLAFVVNAAPRIKAFGTGREAGSP